MNKKVYLVSFKIIVSGGMDGGIFTEPKCVCATKELAQKKVFEIDEQYAKTYFAETGEAWTPYTSQKECGETEGAFYNEIDLIEEE